jgi:hypothetical protein
MPYFPSYIVAGTTFDKIIVLTAYPAPDWELTAILRGPESIDLTAEPDSTNHHFIIAADITKTWSPGEYWYSLRATDGDVVVEVEAGKTTIKPNLALIADGYDGRSHVERVLAAIEAVLEKRATIDQERYKINNRELWRTPVPDLLVLRDRYRAELRRMNAARVGGLFDQHVRVRFQ